MPFLESSHSLKARAGLSHIPTPALVGSIILGLLALIGIGIGFASFLDKTSALTLESHAQADPIEVSQEEGEAREGSSASSKDAVPAEDAEPASIMVHVAGAVKAPGVYRLKADGRGQDAVDAAGGFASNAAAHAVNLAQKLTDGQQLYIPTKKEAAQGSAVSGGQGASSAASGASASSDGSVLININTATEEQLDTLPGVGPATAQAIISERDENGPFASPEDIQRVSGIGQKKYQDMKDFICV